MQKKLSGLKENISLAKHTSFRIGGLAKYFFIAKTKKDLIKAIKASKQFNLPFFVLGGGSNILVSDKGFDGLVIKFETPKLSDLIKLSLENNLTGLEWLVGIPGTIGGAIHGNAGANGKSMKDIIKEVEVYNIKKNKIEKFSNKDCKFKYRNSIFKNDKNLIILFAEIELEKGDSKKSKQIIKEILKDRIEKIPKGYSAGSIFKNPKGYSAGELIEKCDLKGKKIGGAQVSFQHANFIINFTGKAKAEDVMNLIKLIKSVVKDKTGIKLEEEIVFLE